MRRGGDDHELFRLALSSILGARLGFAEVFETAPLDQAVERLDAAQAVLAQMRRAPEGAAVCAPAA